MLEWIERPCEIALWQRDQPLDDVMVKIGRALTKRTALVTFDVQACFSELSELLQVGTRGPIFRPTVLVGPPQWE